MCGGAIVVRRRSSDGSVVEQGRFLLSLHACLCVFEDNGRKRKEKRVEKERARERNRNIGSGSGKLRKKRKKKRKERMRYMGMRVS